MSMRSTHTHTVYFSDESLEELDAAIANVDKDLSERRRWFSEEGAAAVDYRISLLRTARALLAEPVPESFT